MVSTCSGGRVVRPTDERQAIVVPADGRLQLQGEWISTELHGATAHALRVPLRCYYCASTRDGRLTVLGVEFLPRCANLLRPGLALGDRAASALSALMVQHEGPCLRQLDLRANEISDAGAAQLAEGIELNRSITHLLISDNNITDHGALALARALYRNRSLTVLWLDGNSISALGTTAISQAVAANQYLTTVLLRRARHCSQLDRALSAVEKRDLAMIRQACVRNQVEKKTRKDVCHRLQLLAWAIAVHRMSGPRAVPWDLIESVGQEVRRVRGAVYTRWMAQREAEWDAAENSAGAPHISVVRGIRSCEMIQAGASVRGGDAFDPRQVSSPANRRGDRRVPGTHYLHPMPPEPQLGASAHSSGYFSPRPLTISRHLRPAVPPESRKATSARAPQQLRTSMTSWEGRIAQRQARRAELRRIFPHLADTGTPERRQALAIRGTSGSDDSTRLPTLHRVEPG